MINNTVPFKDCLIKPSSDNCLKMNFKKKITSTVSIFACVVKNTDVGKLQNKFFLL